MALVSMTDASRKLPKHTKHAELFESLQSEVEVSLVKSIKAPPLFI